MQDPAEQELRGNLIRNVLLCILHDLIFSVQRSCEITAFIILMLIDGQLSPLSSRAGLELKSL